MEISPPWLSPCVPGVPAMMTTGCMRINWPPRLAYICTSTTLPQPKRTPCRRHNEPSVAEQAKCWDFWSLMILRGSVLSKGPSILCRRERIVLQWKRHERYPIEALHWNSVCPGLWRFWCLYQKWQASISDWQAEICISSICKYIAQYSVFTLSFAKLVRCWEPLSRCLKNVSVS